jgi:hypothetical protein
MADLNGKIDRSGQAIGDFYHGADYAILEGPHK